MEPHWIQGENRFWFKHQQANSHEFRIVDAETGKQAPAFDHDALAGLLNAAGEDNLAPQALPISDLQLDRDGLIVELTTKPVPPVNISGSFAEAGPSRVEQSPLPL